MSGVRADGPQAPLVELGSEDRPHAAEESLADQVSRPANVRIADASVRALAATALASATLLAAPAATASGIGIGRFGGIDGHANSRGGLALYWNAANVAPEPGPYFTMDVSLINRRATYDRQIDEASATPEEIRYNTGAGTVNTIGVLPLLAVGWGANLGEALRGGVALGVFPTFGGFADWDKKGKNVPEYPGVVDGPQRWSAIASRLQVLNYTLAAAATLRDIGVSFGGSAALVDAELDTVKARNLNRTDSLVDSRGAIQEGRIHLLASDTALAWTAGVSLDDERVRAGVHYRAAFDLALTGNVRQAYATNPPTNLDAELGFPLPSLLDLAVTPIFGDFEATLALEYTTWSRVEEHRVVAQADGQEVLVIPRRLRNTVGARVVPALKVSDRWTLGVSVGYESSAVPPETEDAAFIDADKIMFGLGARYDAKWLKLGMSYVRDEYFAVKTENSIHAPAENGTFDDTRDYLQLTVEVRP